MSKNRLPAGLEETDPGYTYSEVSPTICDETWLQSINCAERGRAYFGVDMQKFTSGTSVHLGVKKHVRGKQLKKAAKLKCNLP